ncbi:MAG: hypothetical protein K8M05_41150 [Deltaproteobacteria bacterium]|nr:hypothetical protein [Kofleriaceae bacterium]
MPKSWLHVMLLAPALVAGCGGDDSQVLVDGATAPDAGSDGAPADCHPEADDSRNGSTSEPTGAVFAGQRIAVCGNVDVDAPSGDLVDRDLYQVTVTPSAPVVVRLSAPLGGSVDRLELIVRDATGPRSVARLRAGNAVTALLLPQGEYTLGVEAHDEDAVASFPYRIEMYADNPALRCPPMAGGTIHAEVDESAAGHRANDVIEVRQQPPILEAMATSDSDDEPDETGQAVTAGNRFAIAGSSAGVTSAGDEYRDRDTFSLYTGATTNQLDVRVVWSGGIADLDVLVFEAGKPMDPMGTPAAALIGEEVVVTAVAPQSEYWLWVGGSRRSTSLPVDYTVHVCGREIAAAPETP